jgi:hypothetical protein
VTGAAPTEVEPVRAMLTAEDGGVLVWVAIALPVLILFVGFVIDVGNWFVHDRHLQTQADAAALAGAAELATAFGACDDATDAAVDSAARLYSGEADDGYNHQVGGTSADDLHFVLNSADYYGTGNHAPTDETVVEAPPCEAGMVDVKMTETDLPLFLKVAGLFTDVDFINSHARVQIFQRDRFSEGLPVGVPDPNPKAARVIFVDEATIDPATGQPTVLGSQPLARNGTANGLAIWDNSSNPFPLTVNGSRIGVRVALGGATSTNCGDALVVCYDAGGANGILHVRGYSTSGSGAQPSAPLARSVSLITGTCSDPYFIDVSSSCTIGVSAEVDFGNCTAGGGLPAVGPKLTARVNGNDYPLAASSCPAGSHTSVWQTSGSPISIDPAAGPVDVQLSWEETAGTQGTSTCNDKNNNPCKASFGVVQRTFSARGDRTGPIHFAQLSENGAPWANSLQACSSCTHDLVARIGVELNLAENADSADDPAVALRFGASSGSQNQALDCDPGVSNLKDEIATGCEPEYAINPGTTCPSSPSALWALAQPWSCVAVQTGDATGQIWQGMNLRIHGDEKPKSCVTPNHWSDFPNLDPGDPRIVPVFVTPFGAFSGSGNGTVPVTNFAVFYVTGWHGSQSTCPTDDPAPDKSIVGHFIKYVQAFNDGSAGEAPCDPSELGSCVAVMTE